MGSCSSQLIPDSIGLFQVYSIKQKEGSPIIALTPFRTDLYPKDSTVIHQLFDALLNDPIVKDFMNVDALQYDHFYEEFCYDPSRQQEEEEVTAAEVTAAGSAAADAEATAAADESAAAAPAAAAKKAASSAKPVVPMIVLQWSKAHRHYEPVGLVGMSRIANSFKSAATTPAAPAAEEQKKEDVADTITPPLKTSYSVFMFLSKVARGMFLSESIFRAVAYMADKTGVTIPDDDVVILEAKLNNPMVRQVTLELGCCIEDARAVVPGRIMYSYPEKLDVKLGGGGRKERQIALAGKSDYSNAIIKALAVSCTKDQPGVEIRAITAYNLAYFRQMAGILCQYLVNDYKEAVAGTTTPLLVLSSESIKMRVLPRSSLRAKFEGRKPHQFEVKVGTLKPSRKARDVQTNGGRGGALECVNKDLWERELDLSARELTKSGVLRYYDIKMAVVERALNFESPLNADRADHMLKEECIEDIALQSSLRREKKVFMFPQNIWFDHLRCEVILLEAYIKQDTVRGQAVRDALKPSNNSNIADGSSKMLEDSDMVDPTTNEVLRELEQLLHFELVPNARRAEELLLRYDEVKKSGDQAHLDSFLFNLYTAAEDTLDTTDGDTQVNNKSFPPGGRAIPVAVATAAGIYQAPSRVPDDMTITLSATFKDWSQSNVFVPSSSVTHGSSAAAAAAAKAVPRKYLARKVLTPLETFSALYLIIVHLQLPENKESLYVPVDENNDDATRLKKPLLVSNIRLEEDHGVSYDWDAPYDPTTPEMQTDVLARYFEAGNQRVGASFAALTFALLKFGGEGMLQELNSEVQNVEELEDLIELASREAAVAPPKGSKDECSAIKVPNKILTYTSNWSRGKSPRDIMIALIGLMNPAKTGSPLPFILNYQSRNATQPNTWLAESYPVTKENNRQISLPKILRAQIRPGLTVTLSYDEYDVRSMNGIMDGHKVNKPARSTVPPAQPAATMLPAGITHHATAGGGSGTGGHYDPMNAGVPNYPSDMVDKKAAEAALLMPGMDIGDPLISDQKDYAYLGKLNPLLTQRYVVTATYPIEFKDYFPVKGTQALKYIFVPTPGKEKVNNELAAELKEGNWEVVSSSYLNKTAQWIISSRALRKEAEKKMLEASGRTESGEGSAVTDQKKRAVGE